MAQQWGKCLPRREFTFDRKLDDAPDQNPSPRRERQSVDGHSHSVALRRNAVQGDGGPGNLFGASDRTGGVAELR
jgi:hypothetical protein